MRISNDANKYNVSRINSNLSRNIEKNNERLSSGKKLNSAKDNPSDLAIAKKLETLINGLEKGTDNAYNAQNALSTADGALSSIQSNLSRIRSLGVQASSSLYSDADKSIIQEEVNSLLENINSIANNTEFNNIKLLDGSFQDINIASNADGSGSKLSLNSATTDSLGITGFDVTVQDIDFDALDSAINSISSSRSYVGAKVNSLTHTISANDSYTFNQIKSKSKLEDTDMAKSFMEKQKYNILSQYNLYSQKNSNSRHLEMLNILF